ncbi:MAG: dihydrodipicolinate synthase family protein [Sciscionella sp.]
MTPLAQTPLRGVIPPVCTPLTADLHIDVPSLERLVDHLLDGGVDGLFVLGSTGEVAYLPDSQRRLVTETVVTRVDGRVPVLAGAIDMTTARVAEHAEAALKDGADGVVATAPFYTRTHPAEIERHFRLLADRIDAPIYAYDLPVSVHVKLDAGMLLRLAGDGVLAGLKDSSGDESNLRRLLMLRDDLGMTAGAFAVLTGSELTVDAALNMGADGVVPGYGNVDPSGYARLYRLCRAGDWNRARTEQERLLRGFEIVSTPDTARMGGSSAALGAFKAALRLLGIIDNSLTAPPQIPLDEIEVAGIAKILVRAGLVVRQ